jgi:hypothetical protein
MKSALLSGGNVKNTFSFVTHAQDKKASDWFVPGKWTQRYKTLFVRTLRIFVLS